VNPPLALQERESSWQALLAAVSEHLLADLTLRRVQPIKQLASQHPSFLLASYSLQQPLPDDRSVRYYLAHRLCMLEFTLLGDAFLVKAYVGGSMKQVTHLAVLLLRVNHVVDSCCSCANGYGCCGFDLPPLTVCRWSGCCSHVQCACMMLYDCKLAIRAKVFFIISGTSGNDLLQVWTKKRSELHLQSSKPFATLFSAWHKTTKEARDRGVPPDVPRTCWWRNAIGRADFSPLPLHPEPCLVPPGGMEELKTQLEAIRAQQKAYQCPWCSSANPATFKLVARALTHLRTKHEDLWNALDPAIQEELEKATPSEWQEAFLTIPPLPLRSAATGQLTELLHTVRDALKTGSQRAPSGAQDASATLPPPPRTVLPPPPEATVPPPSPKTGKQTPPALCSTTAAPSTSSSLASPAQCAPPRVLAPPPAASLAHTASRSRPGRANAASVSVGSAAAPALPRLAPVSCPPSAPRAATTTLAPVAAADSSESASDAAQERHRRHKLEPVEKKRRVRPSKPYSPPH
jgi:hypothetical protein